MSHPPAPVAPPDIDDWWLWPHQVDNRHTLVAALRSGKYTQYTGGALAGEVGSDGFCCLGVGVKICLYGGDLGRGAWPFADSGPAMGFFDGTGVLWREDLGTMHDVDYPEGIQRVYVSLGGLNDSTTWSFSDIADLLELDTVARTYDAKRDGPLAPQTETV